MVYDHFAAALDKVKPQPLIVLKYKFALGSNLCSLM